MTEWMTWLFYLAGGLAAISGAAAVAIAVCVWGADVAHAILARIELRGEQREHDRFRDRLLRDSWWFSEDEATMHMVIDLVRDNDISDVRERWRKARTKARERQEPRS